LLEQRLRESEEDSLILLIKKETLERYSGEKDKKIKELEESLADALNRWQENNARAAAHIGELKDSITELKSKLGKGMQDQQVQTAGVMSVISPRSAMMVYPEDPLENQTNPIEHHPPSWTQHLNYTATVNGSSEWCM